MAVSKKDLVAVNGERARTPKVVEMPKARDVSGKFRSGPKHVYDALADALARCHLARAE